MIRAQRLWLHPGPGACGAERPFCPIGGDYKLHVIVGGPVTDLGPRRLRLLLRILSNQYVWVA